MNIKDFIKRGLFKTVSLLTVVLMLASCTNVEQWGVTARDDGEKVEKHYNEEDESAEEIVFGDVSTPSGTDIKDVDFSTWTFDEAKLHKDDKKIDSFGNKQEIKIGEPINVAGLNYIMTVEKVEPFEDSKGSGKKGLAIVYKIENKSQNTIYFSGVLENAVRFAMFGPGNVSLKNHYDLSNPPTKEEEYEGRITYPVQIYSPSMSTAEVEPGKSITMYRTYDYAGTGEYWLYIGTNIKGKFEDSCVRLKIVLE